MAGKRVGSPLGVTLVAMVLAGLVTALVLSFVLEDDETAGPAVLTLAPGAGDGTIPPGELEGEPAPDFTFEPLTRRRRHRLRHVPGRAAGADQLLLQRLRPLRGGDAGPGGRVRELRRPGRLPRPLLRRVRPRRTLELVERTGVTYDIGRDPDGDIITAFAGGGYPTTVFIAADGTITTSHLSQIHPDELQDELDGLLA